MPSSGVSEQGRCPTGHDMLPGCKMLMADGDIVTRDFALNHQHSQCRQTPLVQSICCIRAERRRTAIYVGSERGPQLARGRAVIDPCMVQTPDTPGLPSAAKPRCFIIRSYFHSIICSFALSRDENVRRPFAVCVERKSCPLRQVWSRAFRTCSQCLTLNT